MYGELMEARPRKSRRLQERQRQIDQDEEEQRQREEEERKEQLAINAINQDQFDYSILGSYDQNGKTSIYHNIRVSKETSVLYSCI